MFYGVSEDTVGAMKGPLGMWHR